jgi:hypothetical protein
LVADHVAMYVGGNQVVEAYTPQQGIISSPESTRATLDPVTDQTLQPCGSGVSIPCFLGYRRVTTPIVGLNACTFSPVDLTVTDPDGFTITPQTLINTHRESLREIPGELYYSEWGIGNDNRPGSMISAPVLKAGDYLITVVPKAGTTSSDTYSLVVGASGQTVYLTQNTPIADIPPLGYGIESTGTSIHPFIPVGIDIKPGGFPNAVNPGSSGTIPVAVLSNPTFNAPAEVDVSSLTFGESGNQASLALCNAEGEDVNGDGLPDLVCHFYTQNTGFQAGDTLGILRGRTIGGELIRGVDSVVIVP